MRDISVPPSFPLPQAQMPLNVRAIPDNHGHKRREIRDCQCPRWFSAPGYLQCSPDGGSTTPALESREISCNHMSLNTVQVAAPRKLKAWGITEAR